MRNWVKNSNSTITGLSTGKCLKFTFALFTEQHEVFIAFAAMAVSGLGNGFLLLLSISLLS